MREDIVARATARDAARRTFWAHLTFYLFVNVQLFIADASTPRPWWFFWPAAGWGLGLAAHAWSAFARGGATPPADAPPAPRREQATAGATDDVPDREC